MNLSILLQILWTGLAISSFAVLFVMGGRAREFKEYANKNTVGGIMGPRVQDPADVNLFFTSHREASALKNDVWRSVDGVNWQLVTPGCRAPQASLVPQKVANIYMNGKIVKNTTYGMAEYACSNPDSSECYGEEQCDVKRKTCVCNMWSPREQFGATVYNGWIYVAGGYTSIAYSQLSFCGEFACGEADPSDYRNYMNVIFVNFMQYIHTSVFNSMYVLVFLGYLAMGWSKRPQMGTYRGEWSFWEFPLSRRPPAAGISR